jgi:hypothetical protein
MTECHERSPVSTPQHDASDSIQAAPTPRPAGGTLSDISELDGIDTAARMVETVHTLPLNEQVSVLTDIHSRLQSALTEIDSTSR